MTSRTDRPPRLLEQPARTDVEAVARLLVGGSDGPVPDDLKERVWSGFVQRIAAEAPARPRARSPARLLWPALAAAAAGLIAAVLWPDAGDPDGRAVDVRGVARLGEDGSWSTLVTDAPVELPAVVKVRRGGSAEVALARGVSVRVDGPATIRLDAHAAQVDAGRALHRVTPGHGRWFVQLGDYRVVVKGTQFWTARAGDEAAVCLLEGRVEIRRGPDLVAHLAPGEAWHTSPRAPAFPGDLACRLDESGRGAELARGSGSVSGSGSGSVSGSDSDSDSVSGSDSGSVSDSVSGSVSDSASDSVSDADSDSVSGSVSDSVSGSVSASLSESRSAPRSEPPSSAALDRAVTRGRSDAVTPVRPNGSGVARSQAPGSSPAADPTSVTAPAAAPPAPPPVSPPESAAAPAAAAAPEPPPATAPTDPCARAQSPERCYRTVADGATLLAENALVRLGELQRDRGDAAGAIETWLEYRRRFPRGSLAQEADLAILEMRLRQRSSLARAAAERFLEHWPRSEHTGEVHAIRGALLQRAGAYEAALGDFEQALAARISPARRDESGYGRAACLAALGRRLEAADAYRAYLRAHPSGRFATHAREGLRAIEAAEPSRG